jgi:hypothetical protein
MEPDENKSRARSKWARAAWWALAALILWWVFRRVPLGEVLAAAERGRLGAFAAVAAGFTVATFLFDSLTHFWLFRRFLPPVAFKTVLRARGESYLLLSLGFLYGQGGMAYLMSRRTGKPVAETAGALLFIMFANLIAMMIFPTFSALFFMRDLAGTQLMASEEWRLTLRWLAISWPLCILLALFWARDWNLPFRRRLKQGVGRALDQARPGDYAVAVGLRGAQVLSWCFFSWLGLRSFGLAVPFRSLLLLGPIVGLAAVIPTPGRLGTSQGAWLLLFGRLLDPAGLLAFSLVWTIGINLLRWLIGAVFFALAPGAERPGAA